MFHNINPVLCTNNIHTVKLYNSDSAIKKKTLNDTENKVVFAATKRRER